MLYLAVLLAIWQCCQLSGRAVSYLAETTSRFTIETHFCSMHQSNSLPSFMQRLRTHQPVSHTHSITLSQYLTLTVPHTGSIAHWTVSHTAVFHSYGSTHWKYHTFIVSHTALSHTYSTTHRHPPRQKSESAELKKSHFNDKKYIKPGE